MNQDPNSDNPSERAAAGPKGGEHVYAPEELGFCCAFCTCGRNIPPTVESTIRSGHRGRPHRICCGACGTSEAKQRDNWATPLDRAIDAADAAVERGATNNSEAPRRITERELKNKRENAQKLEKQYANSEYDVDSVSLALTCPKYVEACRKFREVAEQSKYTPKPCVVLDMFSGIGTGLVVLKRLGIDVSKYVHVDFDKVAKHVFRSNHDVDYNLNEGQAPKSNDHIEYVYYERFEEIDDELDAFMEMNGPIDLIIGGPPCQDFTGINASKQGTEGKKGQYMVRFCKLIRKIERHRKQAGTSIFFVAENVVLRGQDLAEIVEAIDANAIPLDARDVSPCRRKRHFFTNIRFSWVKEDENNTSTAQSCLDDGFMLPGDVHGEHGKALTFLASQSRINDDRMKVVKLQDDGSVIARDMTVVERERMMGYPDGYVSGPTLALFEALCPAYVAALDENGAKWSEKLDKKFYCFSGLQVDCQFDCQIHLEELEIKLKLAPPETKGPFLDCGYAKHLIGIAYSVVVVESLLAPLKDIFKHRSYENYQYEYKWLQSEEDRLEATFTGMQIDNPSETCFCEVHAGLETEFYAKLDEMYPPPVSF